jgi:hypothetical protein
MNKLTQVKKALFANDAIIVGVTKIENRLPYNTGGWAHTLNFHVAPAHPGLYTAKELQSLMVSLVPKLKPTAMDPFEQRTDSLCFGKLYFDEQIGTTINRYTARLSDQDLLLELGVANGWVDGKHVVNTQGKLMRRIWVSLFPNAKIASDASANGINKYGIKLEELEKYYKKPSMMKKLVDAFSKR